MIKTFTGPMHSGKTEHMIDIYSGIYNKECIKVFKPLDDTRDFCLMKSKTYDISIPAIGVDKFEDILGYVDEKTRTIFLDEVQLMTGNIAVLNYLSIVEDMDIYLGGLNMTSEQEPFLIMPQILAISDKVENIPASCYDCGREATLTYYEGSKSGAVLVGDKGYFPLCHRCLVKRRGQMEAKKIMLKSIQAPNNKLT
ncbi:MAG TPA: hypothetical protein DCE23_05735 [Firmicutes bacterium]|nr:hypothetical protein [Bacillota bacterium]